MLFAVGLVLGVVPLELHDSRLAPRSRIRHNKTVVTFESLRQSNPAINVIAAKYGARNLRVFGSVARGTNRPDSDVDFLVDFEPGRTLFDLIGLRLDLSELLGASADVTTPDSLRYIRESVLAEARVL